ncbi:chloramphenicol acetyltransferase [Arthrobacter citreus]|nr:chloramphenicol acetyltransferase [Arthrobacter citreus]
MIICFEGASAVGKTTTSNEISKSTNTYVSPEVNLLFNRPKAESNIWYLERQVVRWQIAKEKSIYYDTVILDGDIFQPLSYNWCFDFKVFNQSLDFIADFYRTEIKNGRIGFPDKYFYLYTDTHSLRYRKDNDTTRQRRNFDKHIEIAKPHQRFYEALNNFVPDYVHMIEAKNIEETITSITTNLTSASSSLDISYSLEFLDCIVSWLRKNKA